jgi:oxygen-independent coproporphyrinogen-3 oxidase
VQSFVEKELRRTGRTHTAQTVAREIAVLQAAGIRNINIDLIAGLSGQTAASWRESLDWVERLRRTTSPSTCSKWMKTAVLGKEMLLGGVRYGALDTPPTMLRPISTNSPSNAWRGWGSRATRSPISRGRASNRAII